MFSLLTDFGLKILNVPGVVAHTFNPCTGVTEAGESLSKGQPGLYRGFQDSWSYTKKPCLEINKEKKRKKYSGTASAF